MDEDTLRRYTKGLRQRIKRSDAEIRSLIEEAKTHEEEGLEQVEELVQHYHRLGIPVTSHDDYHYLSLFYAPFLLVEKGLMSFEHAWQCVSEYPADAAKIGKIPPGHDADFILLRPYSPLPNAIQAVYIGGQQAACYG